MLKKTTKQTNKKGELEILVLSFILFTGKTEYYQVTAYQQSPGREKKSQKSDCTVSETSDALLANHDQ